MSFPLNLSRERERESEGQKWMTANKWRVLVLLTVNVAIGLLPAATHSHAWHHTVFLLLLDPRNEGVARKQKRGCVPGISEVISEFMANSAQVTA